MPSKCLKKPQDSPDIKCSIGGLVSIIISKHGKGCPYVSLFEASMVCMLSPDAKTIL
ncbi:hypothetical protein MHB65_12125 [Lysinibacillus sp. FSL K6-0075]|uniref:hypothetical protein n=1 Tax=Lysinibacillus sp. FSL K6-0075 TaxID=2921415 RepID=UPI0031595492